MLARAPITAVFLATAALGAGAPGEVGHEADSLIGKVRVAGSSAQQVVNLLVDGRPVRLSGDPLDEIMRLQSVTIEVLGEKTDAGFTVAEYRIVDIGRGVKPMVGTLVQAGEGLALRDGGGTDIPLRSPPRTQSRLLAKVGAKIWVHGKKLLTGELEVQRYGVLREPPAAGAPPPPEPEADPTGGDDPAGGTETQDD